MNSLRNIGVVIQVHPSSYLQAWRLTHTFRKRPQTIPTVSSTATRKPRTWKHSVQSNTVRRHEERLGIITNYRDPEQTKNRDARASRNEAAMELPEDENAEDFDDFYVKELGIYEESKDLFPENTKRSNIRNSNWRGFENSKFYDEMLTMPEYQPYLVPPIPAEETALQHQVQEIRNHSTEFPDTPFFVYALKRAHTKVPLPSHTRTFLLKIVCNLLGNKPTSSNVGVMLLITLAQLQDEISSCEEYSAKFCFALNSYCLSLLPLLDWHQLFQVCHCYRLLGTTIVPWSGSFPELAMHKLQKEVLNFNKPELVQLYYFISTFRHTIKNFYELEQCIVKYIYKLSMKEMCVVNLAYFKTATPIKNSIILDATITKVQQTTESLDHWSLTTICKSLRYNQPSKRTSIMLTYLKTLNLRTLSTESLAHLVHYMCVYLIYQPVLVDEIKRRLLDNIKNRRLKDLAKYMMYISRVCYDSEDGNFISKLIAKHLESSHRHDRQREINQHPYVFSGLLLSLILMDVYVPELLNKIGDSIFRNNTQVDIRNMWEIWYLDRCMKIDFPQNKRTILPDNCMECFAKYFSEVSVSVETHVGYTQFIMAVSWIFKQIFNNSACVVYTRVLPQYPTGNLIICLDKNLEQGLPIGADTFPECFKTPIGAPKKTSMDVTWLACELLTVHKLIAGTQKPSGLTNAKLRHLRKFGYKPFLLTERDWQRLSTQADGISYLKKCLRNAVQQ